MMHEIMQSNAILPFGASTSCKPNMQRDCWSTERTKNSKFPLVNGTHFRNRFVLVFLEFN